MLTRWAILLLTGFFLAGCHTKDKNQPKPPVSEQASAFFPVTQYILGQLNELDSLPVTPLKIISQNGTSDSVWIKKEQVRAFTGPFTTPVIDSATWHNRFAERSFLDQTINAYTFSYDPVTSLPDSIELRRWDIYVDPVTFNVRRIYIVKQVKENGASQTIQLTWKAGYYCKITTITEKAGAKPQVREEQLIWNFSE